MLEIRTILHPTDFSQSANHALQMACLIAEIQNARLIVFHVLQRLEPPEWMNERMAGEFPWTMEANRVLEQKIRSIHQTNPKLRIEQRVVEGCPSAEILQVAEAESCDLIVMGTHGRTGLDRALVGSVTEEVMRKARCPVLTAMTPSPVGSTTTESCQLERTEKSSTD